MRIRTLAVIVSILLPTLGLANWCGEGSVFVDGGCYCDSSHYLSNDRTYCIAKTPQMLLEEAEASKNDVIRKLEEEKLKLELEKLKRDKVNDEQAEALKSDQFEVEWDKMIETEAKFCNQRPGVYGCAVFDYEIGRCKCFEIPKSAEPLTEAFQVSSFDESYDVRDLWKCKLDYYGTACSLFNKNGLGALQRMIDQQKYSNSTTSEEFEDVVVTNEVPLAFTDISQNTAEGMAATFLKSRNVIGGRPDGSFDGVAPVNRAELAKFLLLAKGYSVSEKRNNGRFPDVVDGHWYVKYVVSAADKGIFEGYPNGTIKPAQTVNTVEFLKMLTETFGLEQGLSHDYPDVSAEAWFNGYAGVAQKYDLFPNRTGSDLQPSRLMTRNEVAVAIHKIMLELEL